MVTKTARLALSQVPVKRAESNTAKPVRHNQCDQMARLFVQYLDIYINESLWQRIQCLPK